MPVRRKTALAKAMENHTFKFEVIRNGLTANYDSSS